MIDRRTVVGSLLAVSLAPLGACAEFGRDARNRGRRSRPSVVLRLPAGRDDSRHRTRRERSAPSAPTGSCRSRSPACRRSPPWPGRASRHRTSSEFRADAARVPLLRGTARGGQERHQRHARAGCPRIFAASLTLKVIFRQQPAYKGGAHFGARLAFDRTGALFVTTGDRSTCAPLVQQTGQSHRQGDPHYRGWRHSAGQSEGRGWLPEIWSIGHRNLQGATIHPETGQLWTVEHGAKGGDELNHPEAGKNYGWPDGDLRPRIFG